MQKNQQSQAGNEVDAEPHGSLDFEVATLLKGRGLCFNPFRLTHSEGDAHLPAVLVRTPVAPHGSAARHVVYGEAGSGKTAKLMRYLVGMNALYPQRRVLLIPFRVPASDEAPIQYAPALAQAFAAALFTTALVHAPAFAPALAATLARAFDQHLGLPNWRALIAGADKSETVALMFDLVDMPRLPRAVTLPAAWRALAQCPISEAQSAPATDATLVELVELALAMGARTSVVLADDFDAPRRSVQAIAAWATALWQVRELHRKMEMQMFLPLAARETVEQQLGPHEAEIIQWDEEALRALLAQRLHVAGARPDMTVASLLGLNAKADEGMLHQAAGSPRRLIALIRDVLEAQARAESVTMATIAAQSQTHFHVVNRANAGVFQAPSEPAETPTRHIPTPLMLVAARMMHRPG